MLATAILCNNKPTITYFWKYCPIEHYNDLSSSVMSHRAVTILNFHYMIFFFPTAFLHTHLGSLGLGQLHQTERWVYSTLCHIWFIAVGCCALGLMLIMGTERYSFSLEPQGMTLRCGDRDESVNASLLTCHMFSVGEFIRVCLEFIFCSVGFIGHGWGYVRTCGHWKFLCACWCKGLEAVDFCHPTEQ